MTVCFSCVLKEPAIIRAIFFSISILTDMRTFKSSCISIQYKRVDVSTVAVIIIIIIIERKDLGGVMSKDFKDTLQTLKTVTKRECDAK